MRLLGISASLTKGGRTRAAVQLALDAAHRRFPEIERDLLDLRDARVALLDGRPLADYPDDTARVVDTIQRADCFVVGSPIYRGTYTGALKNLLDHVPVEGFLGKVVGLVATGATAHHYLAIDHEFRAVMAWFNAYVAPGSVYVESTHFRESDVADEQARDHLRQLGESVVVLAQKLRGVGAEPPPLSLWARA